MKNFVYFLIGLSIFSCTSNTIYKKPKNLIPRDSMVLLLKDMYIATSSRHIKNKFSKKKKNYMPLVYEKYKIDSSRFEISNNFYTSNIETYNEMVKEVKKKLAGEFAIYDNKIKQQDSIKAKRKLDLKKEATRSKKKRVDSLLLVDKAAEIEKIKKSIKNNAKDSTFLKKKIIEIERISDSIKNEINISKILDKKIIEVKKISDSIKNNPKNSKQLKIKIIEIEKIIDSIDTIIKDKILLKDTKKKTRGRTSIKKEELTLKAIKDQTKKKLQKEIKNTEKTVKPLKKALDKNTHEE